MYNNARKDNTKSWGHKLRRKDDRNIRICFHNTNGLPLINNHHKNEDIYNFLQTNDIDTFGISEVNVNWNRLPIDQRWPERTMSWFQKSRTTFAYLAKDKLADRFQRGGTGIMNIGGMTRRFIERGWDNMDMGRWVWCRYRGKKNQCVRIITVYAPTRKEGRGCSVYSQQRRIMLENDDERCPIKAFWEDLWKNLEEWTQQGDHIILGGDFNENVMKDTLVQKFRDLGLSNVLYRMHPSKILPNTHREGTRPIDGIFMSEDISARKSGYLNFDEGISSDHRAVWIDIPIKELFDKNILQTSFLILEDSLSKIQG